MSPAVTGGANCGGAEIAGEGVAWPASVASVDEPLVSGEDTAGEGADYGVSRRTVRDGAWRGCLMGTGVCPEGDLVGTGLASSDAALAINPMTVVASFAMPKEGIWCAGSVCSVFITPGFTNAAEYTGL